AEDGIRDDLVTGVQTCALPICHFTPERWAAFKKDIAFFRARVNDKRWEEIHHDHGYNASPVWTLLGYVITNSGPATLEQVVFVRSEERRVGKACSRRGVPCESK